MLQSLSENGPAIAHALAGLTVCTTRLWCGVYSGVVSGTVLWYSSSPEVLNAAARFAVDGFSLRGSFVMPIADVVRVLGGSRTQCVLPRKLNASRTLAALRILYSEATIERLSNAVPSDGCLQRLAERNKTLFPRPPVSLALAKLIDAPYPHILVDDTELQARLLLPLAETVGTGGWLSLRREPEHGSCGKSWRAQCALDVRGPGSIPTVADLLWLALIERPLFRSGVVVRSRTAVAGGHVTIATPDQNRIELGWIGADDADPHCGMVRFTDHPLHGRR